MAAAGLPCPAGAPGVGVLGPSLAFAVGPRLAPARVGLPGLSCTRNRSLPLRPRRAPGQLGPQRFRPAPLAAACFASSGRCVGTATGLRPSLAAVAGA
eukprot:15434265-Alexandrium_andersonii.AAC.1